MATTKRTIIITMNISADDDLPMAPHFYSHASCIKSLDVKVKLLRLFKHASLAPLKRALLLSLLQYNTYKKNY